MPFDRDGKYYLEDISYHGMMVLDTIYQRAKIACEKDLRSQNAFEGMIRLFEDCGLTRQLEILKLFEEH